MAERESTLKEVERELCLQQKKTAEQHATLVKLLSDLQTQQKTSEERMKKDRERSDRKKRQTKRKKEDTKGLGMGEESERRHLRHQASRALYLKTLDVSNGSRCYELKKPSSQGGVETSFIRKTGLA